MKRFLLFILFFIPATIFAKELPANLEWITNDSAEVWADPKAEKGGTFTDFALTFPPTLRTVGPDSNSSFRQFILSNQMGLVTFHPNTYEIIPELATHWAYGKDNKTVYYKLNPKARWSDGTPVTADDFLYTLEFMTSPHIQAPWYNNHYSNEFEDITKYDEHTISITGVTARPKDELHYYYGVSPTPKHFYQEKLNEDWVKNFNWQVVPNTGPYQISDIRKGKSIEFKRKKDWWAQGQKYNVGRYNVDEVVIKVIRDVNIAYKHFEKGELDSFGLTHPDFWHNKAKGRLYEHGYLEKITFYNDMPRNASGLFLNTANPILADQNVRLGLAYSMNFQKVIETVLKNDYERLNAFHEGFGEYSNPNIIARPYDLAKADSYFSKAGWTEYNGQGIRTKNGQPLSLTIVYPTNTHTDRWTVIKQEAKKAGVDLNLKLLDSSTWYKSIMQKQHEISAGGFSGGFRPAYWQHYHSENANKPQTNNITNFSTPELDDLIMKFRKSVNKDERTELSRTIEQKIHDSATYIPAYKVPYTRGAKWRWLKLPENPGTKTTDNLFFPFGTDGLFWINSKTKIDTLSARKSKTRYKPVTLVFDQYKKD